MAMRCPATAKKSATYKRAVPPAHYLFKIESFKVLSKLDKYDSGVFEAGGYKWRLSLYPKGNKDDNGSGYISLYLSMEELPSNHTVHINYKLFVRDKSQNKYWTIRDADEAISSSQRSQTRYGFPQFLSLQEFKNGYLEQNNSCEFGAEVFVIQSTKMTESFTLISYRPKNTFTYKFKKWSESGTDCRSREFEFENKQWKLLVYPKGNEAGKGKSLSVYLEVRRLTEKMKVYAEFNLRVLDPLKKKNMDKPFECWLSAPCSQKGDANFMPQKDLKRKGFVQNDTLLVEVQISVVSKFDVSKRAGV